MEERKYPFKKAPKKKWILINGYEKAIAEKYISRNIAFITFWKETIVKTWKPGVNTVHWPSLKQLVFKYIHTCTVWLIFRDQ